ncbi:unnamed protein product [Caenorhabditis bovis]|uniref:Uncharacterized protein n=1 Tax=Caenorhabditis bovis TaxID=2654633 RepID=A0A8S1E705_9PELO|nr:unnamed protein product [Caenorhabditis bovis]
MRVEFVLKNSFPFSARLANIAVKPNKMIMLFFAEKKERRTAMDIERPDSPLPPSDDEGLPGFSRPSTPLDESKIEEAMECDEQNDGKVQECEMDEINEDEQDSGNDKMDDHDNADGPGDICD